jgi:hypothetical protein
VSSHTPRVEIGRLSLGEVLDHAIWLVKGRFGTVCALACITYAPFELTLHLVAEYVIDIENADFATSMVFVYSATFAELLLWFPLYSAALIHVFAGEYLGTRRGVGEALLQSLRLLPRMAAAGFLRGVPIIIGYSACVLPGVFVHALFLLTGPVIVLEGATSWRGIVRGSQLAATRYVPAVGAVFAYGVFILGMSIAAEELLPGIASAIMQTLVDGLSFAILTGAATALYLSIRAETEHLDLELLVAAVDREDDTKSAAL